MDKNLKFTVFLILVAVSLNLGMRSPDEYDQDARTQEKAQKQMEEGVQAPEPSHPINNFATGVKEMTVDNAKAVLSDTAEGTTSEKPVIGTLDGAQKGGSQVIDNTIKGVKKVVSLGYSKDDSYTVEEPTDHSGDAAKIKLFKF